MASLGRHSEATSEATCLCAPSLCDPGGCGPQASLFMEFSRQEYWSRLAFPSLGDLPDSEIESASPELTGGFFITEPPGSEATNE